MRKDSLPSGGKHKQPRSRNPGQGSLCLPAAAGPGRGRKRGNAPKARVRPGTSDPWRHGCWEARDPLCHRLGISQLRGERPAPWTGGKGGRPLHSRCCRIGQGHEGAQTIERAGGTRGYSLGTSVLEGTGPAGRQHGLSQLRGEKGHIRTSEGWRDIAAKTRRRAEGRHQASYVRREKENGRVRTVCQ